ncbi:MAG: HDOD domain-containing protein [Chitinispirillaceae bacterium]|nr:HDOD domain-containing protein [Chitinispirillaceae bacterium]
MLNIQRLHEIQNLPTLPEVIFNIQRLIMSEEGNASILARIIEHDPPLTAKILRVANSSFYCAANSGKISSVQLAITRIGFNEVGHIAMAVNIIKQFSHQSDILDYREFWKHALKAAYLCNYIGSHITTIGILTKDFRHLFFLAGLLHDIGILIYDQFFHEQFDNIIKYALTNETSFLMAEKNIIPGENHSIIGGELLSLWKIDQAVVSAVRFHHSPEKSPESHKIIVNTLYLCEYFLCNNYLGSFEGAFELRSPEIMTQLKLSIEQITEMLEKTEKEVEESEIISSIEKKSSFII